MVSNWKGLLPAIAALWIGIGSAASAAINLYEIDIDGLTEFEILNLSVTGADFDLDGFIRDEEVQDASGFVLGGGPGGPGQYIYDLVSVSGLALPVEAATVDLTGGSGVFQGALCDQFDALGICIGFSDTAFFSVDRQFNGNASADWAVLIANIPAPASLPLLAGAMALFGIRAARRHL